MLRRHPFPRRMLNRLAVRALTPDLLVVERDAYEDARTKLVRLDRTVNASGHLLSRAYAIGTRVRFLTADIGANIVRAVRNVTYAL